MLGGRTKTLPRFRVHTLVIGSGAAGLNAAVQLRRQGMEDVLIVTEGLRHGHLDQHRQRQADLLQAGHVRG